MSNYTDDDGDDWDEDKEMIKNGIKIKVTSKGTPLPMIMRDTDVAKMTINQILVEAILHIL